MSGEESYEKKSGIGYENISNVHADNIISIFKVHKIN